MTMMIDLPPDIETSLADRAAARGLTVQQYVRQLLEAQVTGEAKPMSAAERAAFWRRSTAGLPHTPPLSDRAIDRETLYDSRG